MNLTTTGWRGWTSLSRCILAALIPIGWLLVCEQAQAQFNSTAFYINANSYSAPDNGSGSVTLTVTRQEVSGAINNWNITASAQVEITLTASGTYPIVASDVPTNWQQGYQVITIPANFYSTTVTIPISLTTNVYYDRTGTFAVINYMANPTLGYTNATLTVQDDNSHVGVAAFTNSTYYSGDEILEGGISLANTVDIRFFRDYAVSARTIAYSLTGSTAVAGTDYSPSIGTVTLPLGSAYVDVVVAANNALQTTNKTLDVQITSSSIYQPYSGFTNLSVTILNDFPGMGVYSTVSSMLEGQSGGFVFYNTNAYVDTPAETVHYSVGGTAANGSDYSPTLSGTLTIPAGTYSVQTNISATLYNNVVGTKTATLSVTANADYAIATSGPSATITILPDVSIITVSTPYQNEYAYQNGPAGQITLTRTGGTDHSVTANLVITGTATPGVNYTALATNVTFAANQTTANLTVTPTSSPILTNAASVVLTLASNADYFLGVTTQAVVTLLPVSDTTNSVPSPVGRYWRGTGSDPTYWSQVVPLDYETGTVYSNLYGNAYTLYGISAWSSATNYHYNATNALTQASSSNRIAFNNPIVAFGERVGGTPLYINQPYSFGVYAGDQSPLQTPFQIAVFNRTNFAVAGYIVLYPPNMGNNGSWNNYTSNGFQSGSTNYLSDGHTVTTNTFGLNATLSDTPDMNWGASQNGAYVLTQTASSQATNYYYLVETTGWLDAAGQPVAQDISGNPVPSLLYSLEFEQRPLWRATFLDQPQFNGSPLPPYYAGMTLSEMLTNTPPVTNAVSSSFTNVTTLDTSPELRDSPILDSFVASMGNDPVALANYVINNVDLTDPMDYNDNGSAADPSVNPSGVTRDAQGTFLEKQGSPIDQCALLVYLLREAGVPAVYEFAPHNGLMILDARLSQMLKFQVHGGYTQAGQLYTTNTMIPVNYPWVAAYIGTNWVHIFPWLKDYGLTEGLNLWEETPTNYSSAYPWVRDYIYGNTNLLSLASNGDNTLRVIFPNYLQQTLLQNHPGVSMDDIGMQIVNRQHYYARWQDFPTPTWVTNVSTTIQSLSDTAITNVNPALTNVFDTVSVEIYSVTDPTKDIQTGDLRLADLENRLLYITQTNSATNQITLSLILASFRTNVTTQESFTNDSTLLSREVLTMNLGQYDDELKVRFRYHRNRAVAPSDPIDPNQTFLGFNAFREIDIERPLRKGDLAAVCMNYGQVTRDMLDVHAQNIWQMQNNLQQNPSATNSVSTDVYQGETMFLAGMTYYQKVSEFDQVNRNLNKIDVLSTWSAGLSKISPARDSTGSLTNGTVNPILPNVDMFFYDVATVGNGSATPNSGATPDMADQNYELLAIADGSAEEHQAINDFYQQTNAVSTVRLLQIAQSSGAGIVPLNINNYTAKGTTVYQGQQLQNWDSNLWSQVTAAFNDASDSNYCTAYITPGPMTNAAYKGMGALVLGWSKWAALISPESLNGAFGEDLPINSITQVNTPSMSLSDSDNLSFSVQQPPDNQSTLVPAQSSYFDAGLNYNQILNGAFAFDPTSILAANNSQALSGLPILGTFDQTVAQDFMNNTQSGNLGNPNNGGSSLFDTILDPVRPITGEFYVDTSDLQLPGPLPLALRRNYSSQNLANNQFGFGWKMNIMPYLSISTNATNIYAADMDGAVLAYVQTATNASVWLPTLAANPQLDNNTTAGVGGLANRLRDRLVQTVVGSTTNYTLYGADGSVRVFQAMTFNNGVVNLARPYLQKWTDNCGNSYTFTYGTDPMQPSYGQVTRILCSNGNYFDFDYDIYGHIIYAYTGDGRWVQYVYDTFGDLIQVTLPDESTCSYQYQHGTQAVTNNGVVSQQPYSTHLVIEEDKPEGRELINAYDSQRRVTNQLSTAGVDLNPIRTGAFVYSNNFNITNSYTNVITGYTLIVDGNGNTNRYDYTNSLLTKITDPLSDTIQQIWYPDNATSPGYPRSVQERIDKRGLITQYKYDSNGNVTNTVTTGDLLGDGNTSETATNTAAYNSNCLPLQRTDPVGNSLAYVYDPTFTFLPQQVIHYAGATAVSTDFMYHGGATNVVNNGSITVTNEAFGLLTRVVRAYGSPDAATNDTFYSGQGFPTKTVRYTGTSDPNITNTFFYNERDEMVTQVDALGAVTFHAYDAMDRPIETENFDEFGNALSWNFIYYNENGEVSWTEGPRYNPENYVFNDYDGDGRVTTQIRWRSEAKSDGSGVEAPSGFNLYAQTFNQYDPVGNVLLTVDPRGAETTNVYNALSERVQTRHLDTNSVTVLSTEGYGYEPGGEVQYYTNALGGLTTTHYSTTGKPEFQSNPDGSTNAWRYYLDGRIYREIQRNGAYWQTTYNDANRITTRTFYSALGVPEATNSVEMDRRGNVIARVDENGNVFTNGFDGLDRAKVAAGPAIVTVSAVNGGITPGGSITYTTNVLQQATTNFFDVAARSVTNLNALGEKSVTAFDAIQRQTSRKTFNSGGSLAHETYFAYSADHNSVTVTNGSGATAIVNTTYTDNDGHPVLSIGYPASGVLDYTLNQYDLSGNLVHQEHDTSASGVVNLWTFANYTVDGLNRVIAQQDRDGAETYFAFDGLSDLTNRTIPGGVQWSAAYNNAGQVYQDVLVGTNASVTRSNSYTYFSSSSPYAGLLDTKTDGRGMVDTYSYDDRLRTLSVTRNDPDYNHLDTFWSYDARGYATNITEQFTGYITGADPKVVSRTFDPYGQLSSETITVNGVSFSGSTQSWDAAGRRSGLAINDASYNFAWNADGTLAYAADPTGSGSYTFDTSGLLTGRSVGSKTTTIAARDGEGRPNIIYTYINGVSELAEGLGYYYDGLLANDTLYRPDFTDTRNYSYALLSRRLTSEQLNLSGSATWTNQFGYDSGTPYGPGILTQMGVPNTNKPDWTGGVSPFGRVNTETNTSIDYPAYGRLNGQSTLSAFLDGQPVPVTTNGSSDTNWPIQWRTEMELTPGAHQLKVSALHPSGFYTALATNFFTNNLANQAVAILRDGDGNITKRTWVNSDGATNLTQLLYFDARDRLDMVNQFDSQGNGFLWLATYDGLNRRLLTQCYPTVDFVTQVYGVTPTSVNQYYDPQAEFLELGVGLNNEQTQWKLYGPDLNGKYGGENGTGGLDAVSPYLSEFNPVISDARGDILAEVTNGVLSWAPSRPTGYGAVPGYRPIALAHGGDLAQSSAWRGHWPDITGYYQIGLRTYDPTAGMWLSYDSAWNERDPNYLTFCGGDPINGFDPDGRCAKSVGNFVYNGGPASYLLNGVGNALNNSSSGNSYLDATTGFVGTLFNEAGGAIAPSTYVNGLSSYGHNIAGYYQDPNGGFMAASSYALTSWNVGAIYSGYENFDLSYDTAGQPVGDWFQRGTVLSGGVASTAGIAAGGLSAFNWATAAPASVPPVISPSETPPVINPTEAPPMSAVADTVPKAGPLPAGEDPYQLQLFPDEPYDRVAQYGNTPTAAQRASVPSGMEFDHNPTLVEHYYEGPGDGSLPGFNLTQTERLQYGASLDSGSAATPAAQRAQGGVAAQYSRQQKIQWGLSQ